MKKNLFPLLIATLLFTFSCSENIERQEKKSEPLTIAEQMPIFPGGEKNLLNFISENVIYPEAAKKQGIQGKVIVKFAVDTDGSITRASVIRGAHPLLDAESLRVINSLPEFSPGMQNGKAVPVWIMLPLTFKLK